jgi:hypothetical protein
MLWCWEVDSVASWWNLVVKFGISGYAIIVLVTNSAINSVIVEDLAGKT